MYSYQQKKAERLITGWLTEIKQKNKAIRRKNKIINRLRKQLEKRND